MSGFTQHIDSPFPDANMLFDPAKAMLTAQGIQNNQLLMQGRQLDLSNANMEQVSRVSAALLNEPDPARRAELYPRYIGMLQSQGYALHAPPTLPDEQTLRTLALQGTPSEKQAEWLANIQANKAYGAATSPTASTATPGTTTAPGAPATGGGPSFAGGIAGFESGGVSNPGDNPRWPVTRGGPAGAHQFIASTWNDFAKANPALFKGMTPEQILAARTDTTPVGPNGEDRSTLATNWYAGENAKALQANNIPPTPANLGIAHALGAGGASKVLSAPDNTPLSQVIPETIAQNPQYGRMTVGDLKRQYARLGPVGGTPTTVAAATPGRVQVASVAPTTATDGTTAPPGSTAAPDASWDLPGAPTPDQPTAPATTAVAPLAATSGVAPPVPVSAPAGGPAPPQLQPLNANSLTDLQQRQIDAVAGTGRMTVQQRMAAEQAFRNQNIQLQQKAFSDWVQLQTLQTSQGQLSVSQQNSALEYWKAAHPDAKVTLSGGEIITQDPRNGQEIAPRIQVNPERTHAVEGVAKWDGQQWVQAMPNEGGAVPGKWLYAGTRRTDFQPTASVPAGANYDIALEDLKKDRGEIAAIGDAGRAAQQDNLRVQEMRDILEHTNTGPGTETAARLRAWIARWTPGELSKWDGSGANLSNPAAIEMFQKLGFVGAVTQERGSTPRGGYQATKLFQQFNPGAQLLTSTNQGLLAQRLIANQAETDYAQAAQDHYNTQHQRLKSPERDYDPLSSFDAKWQAQRNPQVYAAAIGALGGQDPEMWSRGLSKDEIQRVKDVVTRADPNAVIHMPGEGKVVVQPNAKPVPPGFKVQ